MNALLCRELDLMAMLVCLDFFFQFDSWSDQISAHPRRWLCKIAKRKRKVLHTAFDMVWLSYLIFVLVCFSLHEWNDVSKFRMGRANTKVGYIWLHKKEINVDLQAFSAKMLGLKGTENFREHNVSQSASPALLRSKQRLLASHRLLPNSTNINVGCVSSSHGCGDHLVK